jgi:predicted phosphodiesterase
MMRVAALYDIHGNLPALEAVLDDVRRARVDHVVIGGDVVPGPMPRETMDALLGLELPLSFIRGNGEREVLEMRAGGEGTAIPERYRDAMRWVGAELAPEHVRQIAHWPATLHHQVLGLGEVLFCHATPDSDSELVTARTPDARVVALFAGVGAHVVVCGHTHMAFDRAVGAQRVVNAGSVGMPFGAPGAHWLLLGPEIEARCTPYDVVAAAERIRRDRYPLADEFARSNVLETPSADAMVEAFERAVTATHGRREPGRPAA